MRGCIGIQWLAHPLCSGLSLEVCNDAMFTYTYTHTHTDTRGLV